MEVEQAFYHTPCNKQWVYCVNKNNLKHIHHVEFAIHEMKIESTAVEMFWKERNRITSKNMCLTLFYFIYMKNRSQLRSSISVDHNILQTGHSYGVLNPSLFTDMLLHRNSLDTIPFGY